MANCLVPCIPDKARERSEGHKLFSTTGNTSGSSARTCQEFLESGESPWPEAQLWGMVGQKVGSWSAAMSQASTAPSRLHPPPAALRAALRHCALRATRVEAAAPLPRKRELMTRLWQVRGSQSMDSFAEMRSQLFTHTAQDNPDVPEEENADEMDDCRGSHAKSRFC